LTRPSVGKTQEEKEQFLGRFFGYEMWPKKKLQLFPLDVGFPPFAALITIPVGIRCLF
jgi:hypothetical protein